MIVENELLAYPKYKIFQDPERFNFSLDSMLLGYFATVNKKMKNVVDLCTGNAPIPLYLTLRTKAFITGVEIQKNSFDLAVKSVKINNKEDQIKILNDDVKNISQKLGHQSCDLVTCNPPYFKYKETSNINKNEALTIARHEVLLTLDDVCKEVSLLLNNGGYFAMVHRPERFLEIIDCLRKYRLEPKRVQFVYPNKDSTANHLLIEAKKNGNPGLTFLKPLIVYEKPGIWSKEILEIYNLKEE